MTGKKLFEALEQVDEELVNETAESLYGEGKKRGKAGWRRLVAAAVVLVVAFAGIGTAVWYQGTDENTGEAPVVDKKGTDKNTGEAPVVDRRETDWQMGEKDSNVNQIQKVNYKKGKSDQHPEGVYLKNLKPFYQNSIRDILISKERENCAYSPVNLYLCMAMLTEMTDGDTKEQLLDVLGQKDTEDIRQQSKLIWERVYMDNNIGKCILGNSIWLNQDIMYQKDALEILAQSYYTETYQGQMGKEMDKRIQGWVNDMTNNMLKEEATDIQTDSMTAAVLLSTAHFYDQWVTPFSEEDTTKDTFTNVDGEKENCDFMHQTTYETVYEAERFLSTSLGFENDNSMILFVPKEGVTVEELLEKDMEDILRVCSYAESSEDYSYGEVTLSLPKFTISSNLDLIPVMKGMGITDLFDEKGADFSKLIREEGTGGDPVYVDKIRQATKASVDENGCSVASFTEAGLRYGAASPNGHFEINCDHPFLFIISNYEGIPIFAGVVNRMEE